MSVPKFTCAVESTIPSSQSQMSMASFDFSELEELVISAPGPVESTIPPRSQSQMSTVSSESSQSQVGFLGSTLGTSKKGKQPEVKKVLQMAAVAAKRQQEEADKKVARLKEMESRRQLAFQRKAEEERAKVLEEERKMKEEAERRKKEEKISQIKGPSNLLETKRRMRTSRNARLRWRRNQKSKNRHQAYCQF